MIQWFSLQRSQMSVGVRLDVDGLMDTQRIHGHTSRSSAQAEKAAVEELARPLVDVA